VKVIGAGFGRTGTDSLRAALELLLGGRCYHMKELVRRPEHVAEWRKLVLTQRARGAVNWRKIFDGYVATVDWPGANYYEEILAAYPDAKLLLSVRDPDAWFDSFQTLVKIMNAIGKLSFVPRLGFLKEFHDVAVWHEFTDLQDRASCIEVFERHIAEVQARVPADQLLVFRVQDGWDPLCRFLEVDVPDVPFPHVNTRGEIQRFAAKRVAKEVVRASGETIQGLLGVGSTPR